MLTKNTATIAARSLELPGIRHAFFTRAGGVSTGIYHTLNAGLGSSDAAEAVLENRRRVAAHMGVAADRLVTMHQVHSADALAVSGPVDGRPRVDALATATPGLALGVLTADCAPVLLADPVAKVVGVAHAGWRGARDGIVEAAVAAMAALGARRADIRLAIGPTIAQPSYEVGPGFADGIAAAHPDCADLFVPGPSGRAHFDLPGYVARLADRAGVGAVEDLALDTYADEARFFSYRRATHRGEPDYGRLIATIVIEG